MAPIDEVSQPTDGNPLAPREIQLRARTIVEPRAFGQATDGDGLREVPLAQLALACRDAAATPAPTPDLLQAGIDSLVRRLFSADDAATLADIQRLADEGLAVAMTGRPDGAASRFVRANRVLEERALAPRARELAESLVWTREAESETRAGRFEWAAELMEAAFDRDLVLEEAGLELLLAHRIRLAHARLRLDASRGRHGEALLLGAGLLQYLERPAEPPCDSLRPAWRRGWRDHRGAVAPALAADLHRQVAEDQVAALAALEAREGPMAAVDLRRFAPAQLSQVAAWTLFHIARLEGHEARRDEFARAILIMGPRPSGPLCASVAAAVLA